MRLKKTYMKLLNIYKIGTSLGVRIFLDNQLDRIRGDLEKRCVKDLIKTRHKIIKKSIKRDVIIVSHRFFSLLDRM